MYVQVVGCLPCATQNHAIYQPKQNSLYVPVLSPGSHKVGGSHYTTPTDLNHLHVYNDNNDCTAPCKVLNYHSSLK